MTYLKYFKIVAFALCFSSNPGKAMDPTAQQVSDIEKSIPTIHPRSLIKLRHDFKVRNNFKLRRSLRAKRGLKKHGFRFYQPHTFELIKFYYNMRKSKNLKQLGKRADDFEDCIFDPINKNKIKSQMGYIKEARYLNKKLSEVADVLKPKFEDHIEKLNNRIDLARIDHQLFQKKAVRGTFKHPNIPLIYQKPLIRVVGRVFHITQEENEEEEANGKGSATLAHFDENYNILNVKEGTEFNGIITAAHVLSADKNERIIGAYFVPHMHLDRETGFPKNTTSPRTLINFLKYNENSLKLEKYTINVKNKNIFNENNITTSNPQHWASEDIAFVKFSIDQKKIKYKFNVPIIYENIGSNNRINFHKDTHHYFAIGYPGCEHYSRINFKKKHEILRHMSFQPLFITSALIHDNVPKFNNGRILHEAPAAHGMSGGPLLTIQQDQIFVFGCITGSGENMEEGCY